MSVGFRGVEFRVSGFRCHKCSNQSNSPRPLTPESTWDPASSYHERCVGLILAIDGVNRVLPALRVDPRVDNFHLQPRPLLSRAGSREAWNSSLVFEWEQQLVNTAPTTKHQQLTKSHRQLNTQGLATCSEVGSYSRFIDFCITRL